MSRLSDALKHPFILIGTNDSLVYTSSCFAFAIMISEYLDSSADARVWVCLKRSPCPSRLHLVSHFPIKNFLGTQLVSKEWNKPC